MAYSTASCALYFLALLFGLSVGSFLNVVIYRLPRENLSITRPKRSFCPACGSQIGWYDNIPVFSWLWLRARCRSCRKPIAARYPLVELVTGLMAVYLFYIFGLSLAFLFYFYFFCCLFSIALIDLELMVIPMSLVYPTAVIGLLSAFIYPSVELAGPALWSDLTPDFGPRLASLAGALAGLALGWGSLKAVSLSYKLVRGHEGMGDGDPPLLGMIGAFLGWRSILMVILSSTLIGLFSVAVLMLLSRGKPPEDGWGRKPLPFGPFLVLGALFYLFFGPDFLAWYWSLVGVPSAVYSM